MTTDAKINGQLAGAGGGTKGTATSATAAAEPPTSTVVMTLSAAPATIAFQVAWSAAAKRTTAKTVRLMSGHGYCAAIHRLSRARSPSRAGATLQAQS